MKDILEDIARTPLEDLDECDYAGIRNESAEQIKQDREWGPYHKIEKQDFGRYYDFEIIDFKDKYFSGRYVFYAESKAALKWAWAHTHESHPRYGDKGFFVDDNRIEWVVKDAERAGLTDRRYAENENVSNQG